MFHRGVIVKESVLCQTQTLSFNFQIAVFEVTGTQLAFYMYLNLHSIVIGPTGRITVDPIKSYLSDNGPIQIYVECSLRNRKCVYILIHSFNVIRTLLHII